MGAEAYAGNSRFEQPAMVRALSAVTRVIPQETALHGVSGREWRLEGVDSGANQALDVREEGPISKSVSLFFLLTRCE